jgi:predicted ArsR family transcriptional regulator
MNATDPRNLTWQEIQGSLHGSRERIHEWLLKYGPATTTQMAEAMNIGLLTVRPRVSELVAWGFAECVGRGHREGIYSALTQAEAHRRHDASRCEAQTNFKF